MRTVYVIPQRQSGTGNIHSISSTHYDRDIVFGPGCQYAVVLADYYGGKGYTTHRTEAAAVAQARRNQRGGWSFSIIDTEGNGYSAGYPGDERLYT